MTNKNSKFLVIILAIFALVFGFWAKESKLEDIKRFAGADGQSGRVQWNSRRSRGQWRQGWNNRSSRNNRDDWNQDN